jgi:hypothetical protein
LQPWVSESETEPELASLDAGQQLSSGPGSMPVFKAQLRSQRQQEGADAILQASIVGNPKPRVSLSHSTAGAHIRLHQIHWFKNNQPLTPAAGQRFNFTYKGSMVVLKIKMVFPEDQGR